MTKKQLQLYDTSNALRALLWETLAGRKFQLDCGHHITFGKYLGNDYSGPRFQDNSLSCMPSHRANHLWR